MQSSVEHDDGEGQDEAGVSLVKDVGVLLAVVRGEAVHHSVNLHRFTWQSGEYKCYKDALWLSLLRFYLKLHRN